MNQKRELETKLDLSQVNKHYSKASTKGGQNANKNENCVSLHHVPTNIRVVCKDTKSKTKNEEKAMIELRNRVHEFHQGKIDQRHSSKRKDQISGSNSKKRTYKVTEGFAIDHDTNKKVKIKEVMKGKINLFYK